MSRHEATVRAIRDAASRRADEAKVDELSVRACERFADVELRPPTTPEVDGGSDRRARQNQISQDA